jgi:hypothetical protein
VETAVVMKVGGEHGTGQHAGRVLHHQQNLGRPKSYQHHITITIIPTEYSDQCCGSGSDAFLPPGSGMKFLRIPDV